MSDFATFSLLDWWYVTIKIVLALLVGSAIGWNRQKEHKPAGLRTHMLVSLGSALFVMIPIYASMSNPDPNLLGRGLQGAIQGVATGVGFLGAGEILHQSSNRQPGKEKVSGLTSAAAIWVSSALGMAIGVGLYQIAILGAIFSLVILKIMKKWERWLDLQNR